jgi:hypothetical protein
MKRLLARLLPLAAMLAFASPAWAGEMTVRGTAIAPDAPGAAPTPTPVPLPRSVSDRLGWARRSLSSASLARLDRLGGPLPAGIAAGFTFPLLRERAQREVASAYPLLGNADVASTALVVLAMAAGDLDEDLRRLGLEVDSMESARRKLEERRTELRARLAADAAGRTTEAAARRERARRTTARWRAFVPERAATSHAHLEFTEAPGIPALPAPDTATSATECEIALRDTEARLDSLRDSLATATRRLRLFEGRRARFVEELSVAAAGKTEPSATLVRDLR